MDVFGQRRVDEMKGLEEVEEGKDGRCSRAAQCKRVIKANRKRLYTGEERQKWTKCYKLSGILPEESVRERESERESNK